MPRNLGSRHAFGTTLLAPAAATLLAACGAADPAELAAQGQPAREQPYDFTFDDTFDCGTFDAAVSGRVSGVVTTFFDRTGAPVRLRIHERYFGVLTNLGSGYTLTDGPDAYTIVEDFIEDTVSVRGLFWMVRDANGRKVAIDVGTITFSPDGVTIAGPHDVFDAENGICTFLDR